MKILVCVKQVPKGSNVKFDENNNLIRENLSMEMNRADKYALEMALSVKDLQEAEISVLTMGLPTTEDMIKETGELNVSNGYIITDKAFGGADTLATSYTISQAIKHIGSFDLIFCGVNSSDGVTGQVGPQLSQHLNLPLVSYVQELSIEENKINATRINGGYIEKITSTIPSVITVTTTAKELRTPIKSIRKKNNNIQIQHLTSADFDVDIKKTGFKGSATTVSGGFTPEKLHNGVRIQEISIDKSIDKLFDILIDKKLIG